MAKFIPVEPEKWAEMVKAQAEVARLEALTSEMDKTINASQAECRRLKAEVERLADEVGLMNQLWQKYLTPEIRKAMVKEAKKGGQQ